MLNNSEPGKGSWGPGGRGEPGDPGRSGAGRPGEPARHPGQDPDGRDLAARMDALRSLVRTGDERIRKSVALALGRMGTLQALPLLCGLLDDTSQGVRILACQSLAIYHAPEALPDVLAHVHDQAVAVRSALVYVLAAIAVQGNPGAAGHDAIFRALIALAYDPDDSVRADAVAALAAVPDVRAVPALLSLCSEEQEHVRANAYASLGSIATGETEEMAREILQRKCACLADAAETALVRLSALEGLDRRLAAAAAAAPGTKGAVQADAPQTGAPQAGAPETGAVQADAPQAGAVQADALRSDAASLILHLAEAVRQDETDTREDGRVATDHELHIACVAMLGTLVQEGLFTPSEQAQVKDLLLWALRSADPWLGSDALASCVTGFPGTARQLLSDLRAECASGSLELPVRTRRVLEALVSQVQAR